MLGAAAKYFMTRSAPLLIRQAFATATSFLAFPFAEDIDKALGGFITGFIAMALTLKFAYPILARWLASRSLYCSQYRTDGYVKNSEAARHL